LHREKTTYGRLEWGGEGRISPTSCQESGVSFSPLDQNVSRVMVGGGGRGRGDVIPPLLIFRREEGALGKAFLPPYVSWRVAGSEDIG